MGEVLYDLARLRARLSEARKRGLVTIVAKEVDEQVLITARGRELLKHWDAQDALLASAKELVAQRQSKG